MQAPHPAKLQTFVLLGSIILAYIILHFPELRSYSLQIFTGSIGLFFVLKRLKRAKLWHILPDKMSLEVGILTFAFVYLIGATGNTHSIFYALSYVHLFFLIFSSTSLTSISTIIFLMLFHYAQEPVLAVDEVSALVSLPIIGTILLFAKSQYDEVQVKEVALEREIKDLDTTVKKEATLEHTLKKFIQPKLMLLKKLLDDPEETKETVLKQVTLMETELEKITDRVEAIGEVQPSVEK
jgi:hypothetical protein